MRVCFLFDQGNADGSTGGAELTMREFAAAPEGVEITDLEPAGTVVIGNCVSLPAETIGALEGKRVIRYHNDLARHEAPELREWLEQNATHLFTSPLHRDRYGLDGEIVPPAIDLHRFRPPRQARRNTERKGAVAIASFQNPGKGAQLLGEWAIDNEPLTVYGTGSFFPSGPRVDFRGPLPYEQVPQILWAAERFVHLPFAIEPFGRCVVEAWAAGCEVVANGNVGALHFIEHEPERLESALDDFWQIVAGVTV